MSMLLTKLLSCPSYINPPWTCSTCFRLTMYYALYDARSRFLNCQSQHTFIVLLVLCRVMFDHFLLREHRREALRDEERKMLEDLMNRLKRSIMWNIRFLEYVFKALMFICAFSVFPNERRPPCKTMPWDIVPSLAVLWGVCWMFYSPVNGIQAEEDYEASVDNATLNFPHGSMNEDSNHQFLFSTYNSDQDWDWSNDDFAYIADRLQPWATPAGAGLLPSAFEPMSNFGINTIPGLFTVQSTNSDGGQISSGHSIISTIPRTEFSTETHEATGRIDTNNLQNAPPTTASRRRSTSAKLEQVACVSQPLRPTPLSTQPRSIQLQWKCDRTSCNGQKFRTQSAWKTHMNKHDRPFTCDIPGCSRTEGYGTKGELQRHQKTHRSHLQQYEALPSNDTYYYCSEPGCDRSNSLPTNKPFARKDNRDDHVKRKHGTHFDQHLRSMPSNFLHPENDNKVPDFDFSQQISPNARHSSATGKRKRIGTHEAFSRSSTNSCEDCGGLQTEVDKLKRRVIDLEDKLRSLTEKAETLSEVIRGGWNR